MDIGVCQVRRQSVKMVLKLVFVLCLVSAVISEECYWKRSCVYQHYSSKSTYDSCRGDIRDYPPLQGCEATSVWALVRHGNRNPGDSTTEDIKNITSLKDDIIASYDAGTSKLCAQDIESLRKWTWNSTLEVSQSYLTGIGYEEVYDLAKRLREKYPQILNGPENSYYLRPTAEQRTITSAVAFSHGLTDGTNMSAPAVDQPQTYDQVIRTYEQCDRYQELVKKADVIDENLNDFFSTSDYDGVINAVNSRLGISRILNGQEVYALFEACRFFRSWEADLKSPWCSMFTNEDLLVLEYHDDVKHYYRNGYGSWVNANLGKPAMKDLYEKMTEATRNGGNKLTAYFSHDTMMEMVWSALGLFKDEVPLEGKYMNPDRLWRSSFMGCLSTNMIVVLNRCQEPSAESYKVQIFINEKETDLCPITGCTWDEFVKHFVDYSAVDLEFCSMNYTGPLLNSASWVPLSTSLIFLCLTLFV